MLKTRIITAFILLFGLLGAVFMLPASLWLVFCALVCGGAAWEWGGLARFATPGRTIFAVLTGVLCGVLGALSGLGGASAPVIGLLAPLYLASALFWVLVIPFWLRLKWRLSSAGMAIVVGLVVMVPPALALAHLRQLGPWLLLAVMAMVWVADIAAYFSGRAFGRHKLAPGISPGKTWEGAFGAAAGVSVFGYVLVFFFAAFEMPGWLYMAALPLLLAFTAVSIIGDLFESLLKRQAGIKDSGAILPGHGGILDRIDSLTSTLPMAGLLALWLAR
ncbi:MAG: phosphatidate cytidylyltransferase [Betaproteobacteria bacterium HGW-Betaproteobacteria-19]|nr:MAG: phosphatidate cytidylyltransferase [Betaproteobacteria bacterium HGW-Betaproteobacteria-19]